MTARTVVHFTDATGYGGAEKMMLTLLGGLDQARWRPVLLHYPNAAAERIAAEARELDVETRIVPGTTGLAGARELPALVGAIRVEKPAVFHAHLAWPLRCTRGIVAARLAGVGAIVASQQLYARPVGALALARQRVVSTLVTRYLAVSAAMATEMRPLVANGADRVTVVRNAIDTARFAAVPRGSAEAARTGITGGGDTLLALTLARLDGQKGLDHLLAAAAEVEGVMFAIAGDGPERARLEAEARARGVAGHVRFLGHRDDIPDLLAACDMFVLPSLYEGLPVSVLEAMAAAKPVVATRISGTNEAVVEGETGLLVPPADPGGLAAGIRKLAGDAGLRAALGAAGMERVRDHFSAGAMVERVMGLYEEIVPHQA